jgi:hypothetical protein
VRILVAQHAVLDADFGERQRVLGAGLHGARDGIDEGRPVALALAVADDADMRAHGGLLRRSDLENFKVTRNQPLSLKRSGGKCFVRAVSGDAHRGDVVLGGIGCSQHVCRSRAADVVFG